MTTIRCAMANKAISDWHENCYDVVETQLESARASCFDDGSSYHDRWIISALFLLKFVVELNHYIDFPRILFLKDFFYSSMPTLITRFYIKKNLQQCSSITSAVGVEPNPFSLSNARKHSDAKLLPMKTEWNANWLLWKLHFLSSRS